MDFNPSIIFIIPYDIVGNTHCKEIHGSAGSYANAAITLAAMIL